MSSLPDEVEAGQRLKQTALRDFGPKSDVDGAQPATLCYKLMVSPDDAPVPVLFKYALTLIGLPASGPSEKVAWRVGFTYQGERCEVAHQKFGLRIYLWTDKPAAEAEKLLEQISKKLQASMRTVEKLILDAAPDLLGRGNATVINQHHTLRRAYDYFRERAVDPVHIEDVSEVHELGVGTGYSFTSGMIRMRMNAFHDMVAAITAYLSLLEHDLVLALAFCGFDPGRDNLAEMIGAKWGEKFRRVLGDAGGAERIRQRLFEVVERWRNPYSHGGFEKGQTATIYLHTPGVDAAVPIGLTDLRDSPLFSLLPATETDIVEVFALFDEIDAWLGSTLPEAMQWINSGLSVRFDETFRRQLGEARQDGSFDRFLAVADHQQEIVDNMDF